jgi:hypothetical protein
MLQSGGCVADVEVTDLWGNTSTPFTPFWSGDQMRTGRTLTPGMYKKNALFFINFATGKHQETCCVHNCEECTKYVYNTHIFWLSISVLM